MQETDERELVRRWGNTWKQAGPELEAIRRREVSEMDSATALAALEDAFNRATRNMPPRHSSGMVEMQRLLRKLQPR